MVNDHLERLRNREDRLERLRNRDSVGVNAVNKHQEVIRYYSGYILIFSDLVFKHS